MYNEAVLLMSVQQLITMCIFVTACQIVQGQYGLYNLIPQYFNVVNLYGPSNTQNLLRDYHYETREHVRKSYPKNSYRIMDLETAFERGLLQRQPGAKKQGGKKRRGGGDGAAPGVGDDSDDTSVPPTAGGVDPGGNDEDFPPDPTGKEHADRKKRGYLSSVPDAGDHLNAMSAVTAVVMQAGAGAAAGDQYVRAYVRDGAGGVSTVDPASLLRDECVRGVHAGPYLPEVREMAERVVPGIAPYHVLVLAANAARVTSEAVKRLRRDSNDVQMIVSATSPTATPASRPSAVPKTFGEQSVQHVNSLDTTLKEHDVQEDVQNLFETLVYTTMKFDRSVADEEKRNLIVTMVNATMLFIANILDQ